ncbi:hypothetical protein PRIPAC_77867 [Pristionchus pacificus]|uniref:Uncharacterized protein n=1 Tax=Pristionchus pacificus TaxID=54126 RepID=A0A2A6CBG4_PRIPA|nr:hypothetical protein PRIPAC_77867 [Pristionchus pacificus]|eukprot:PDM75457.1 hypothetical protein PRIPAC_42634 [Pristionchus pacificus]
MAAPVEDATVKTENFAEKSCAEITPSEKIREQIRDRSGIHTQRQKLAIWMGGVQLISYACLCVPLFFYQNLTYCHVNIGMIIVYVIFAIAVLGHIFLICTAIRKVRPGGLWMPMAVQMSISALGLVQLYVMINLYSKAESEQYSMEMCHSLRPTGAEVRISGDYIHKTCMIGLAVCFVAFALGMSGCITNVLLYVELNKTQKEEYDHQNRLILERKERRLERVRSIIQLHERREADAANEGIKTAQEPADPPGNHTNVDKTQPKSETAKSKHRMIF